MQSEGQRCRPGQVKGQGCSQAPAGITSSWQVEFSQQWGVDAAISAPPKVTSLLGSAEWGWGWVCRGGGGQGRALERLSVLHGHLWSQHGLGVGSPSPSLLPKQGRQQRLAQPGANSYGKTQVLVLRQGHLPTTAGVEPPARGRGQLAQGREELQCARWRCAGAGQGRSQQVAAEAKRMPQPAAFVRGSAALAALAALRRLRGGVGWGGVGWVWVVLPLSFCLSDFLPFILSAKGGALGQTEDAMRLGMA